MNEIGVARPETATLLPFVLITEIDTTDESGMIVLAAWYGFVFHSMRDAAPPSTGSGGISICIFPCFRIFVKLEGSD